VWTDVHSGVLQPDGRLFRIDDPNQASVVDLANGVTQRSFPGFGREWPRHIALSPDARFAAYGVLEGSVTVIDTEAGEVVAVLRDIQELNAGHDMPVAVVLFGARFSNDGRWLTAASLSGSAVVWDTTTWRRAAVLQPAIADVNGAVNPVFDPTGRYLAVSRGRTSMVLFDATTLEQVREIPLGVQGLPYQATFDPTGRRLVVVLDTKQALTYDVATGDRLAAPLTADWTSTVTFVDSDTLAIPVPERDLVRLWHLDLSRIGAQACRAAGRNLTRDEWQRLGPVGEPYRLTCPQFGEPPTDPTMSVEQLPVVVDLPAD
jgi:WD40 repeat protein